MVCHNVGMTYQCTAIFAKGDERILAEANRKWKGCLSRTIDKPFQGLAFAAPTSDRCYPLVFNSTQQKEFDKTAASMKAELTAWSEKFPSTIFVYVEAECFGGDCAYEGFAVQNGIELCIHKGKSALTKLVAYLDVELDESEKFEPFTRGFFHICRES